MLWVPKGFPGVASGKEPACQSKRRRRRRFNPWVRTIPCWSAWQPTPVPLPDNPHGQSVMPRVRVPKTERIRRPQQCKSIKGFIASSSQGSCHIQHGGVEQEPRAQIYSSVYKFRTKTGSWQGLIGCRGFLVFTDWPVIIPLIGQSYQLSDWPELPSPEAPEV